jgi:hypothetical protein
MPPRVKTPVWPDALVDRVAADDCVVFVGAGVSANSENLAGENPPRWKSLLEDLISQFATTNTAARKAKAYLRNGDYLGAAEYLAHLCEKNGRRADFRERIVTVTDGSTDGSDPFQGNDLHARLGDLNPRIIVTTNYDKILERHFQNGYRVKQFTDTDIAATIRRGRSVLLKLHGTMDASGSTILTRTDFARLRKDGAHALETLGALLLTRTVLFIGYSLDDPDLRLLLENLFGAQGQQPGHYLLTSSSVEDADREVFKTVYGVELLTYQGDHYAATRDSLTELVAAVENQRTLMRVS